MIDYASEDDIGRPVIWRDGEPFGNHGRLRGIIVGVTRSATNAPIVIVNWGHPYGKCREQLKNISWEEIPDLFEREACHVL